MKKHLVDLKINCNKLMFMIILSYYYIMGCSTAKQVAMQELMDIGEILKIENTKLDEEKENLLKDQIDKPADDKEIQQSIKKMTLELEDTYRKAYQLLQDLIASAEYQRDGSPAGRVSQIYAMRLRLEETYKRIENCYMQKMNYSVINSGIKGEIEKEKQKNREIEAEIQAHKEKKTEEAA